MPEINRDLPKIVIDGANVAMTAGGGSLSATGLSSAINYWRQRGHQTFTFVPGYLADKVEHLRRVHSGSQRVFDNIELVDKLVKQKLVTKVPSDTNDDLFVIIYAMTHSPAFVVSNDRYRKEVS